MYDTTLRVFTLRSISFTEEFLHVYLPLLYQAFRSKIIEFYCNDT